MPKYAKIGDKFEDDDKPSVFELVLDDHVNFADPKDFGLKDVEFINPADYFVTSGDAVEKAKVLERDLWKLAGDLRKVTYEIIADENSCTPLEAQALFREGVRPKKGSFVEYESAVWKSAGASRKLRNNLEKAKGQDCFLETEWENHHLKCIPKNPRK